MANADVVTIILDSSKDMITYLLPVIAVLSGVTFIFSFLLYVTIGIGRHTFRA